MDRRLKETFPLFRATFLLILLILVGGCSTLQGIPPPGAEGMEGEKIEIEKPPMMVLIRSAGVYYAPESEDDIFLFGGKLYYYTGKKWFESKSYSGPWEEIPQSFLPGAMEKIPSDKFKHGTPRFDGTH